MTEPTLFPAWKQAVSDFLAEFQYGSMVSLEWLESKFGMPSLTDSHRMTAEQFKARQFEWLANIEAFKDALLKDHQVCLQSVRGRGYRWVPPHEQTGLAVREFEREARRVFRQTGSKLRNLRHTELTDEQRRSNLDATTRLSALAGMARKALVD
jgi:hypothetical protein